MRAIFGIVSLLIVLAIVGTLGKKQLQALGLAGQVNTRVPGTVDAGDAQAISNSGIRSTRDGAATVAVPGGMGGMAGAAPAQVEVTVPMQAQSIQNNVRDATNAALQRGADRSNQAQP